MLCKTCVLFFGFREKMEPFDIIIFLKKKLVLKVFKLYKENSCIKKILIINFFSAICVVAFLWCKHSNFSDTRNNVSANNRIKYLPYIFLLKAHQQTSKKTVFRKVLFLWSSMPSFSFIGYNLAELFRKSDNWWHIYKQTSSTFYTSNDVSRRKKY